MSVLIKDAKTVCEIVRKFAEATSQSLIWRDVVKCEFIAEREEWHVVYEASPSLVAPYYRYEAVVDAKTGEIKSVRRIEEVKLVR